MCIVSDLSGVQRPAWARTLKLDEGEASCARGFLLCPSILGSSECSAVSVRTHAIWLVFPVAPCNPGCCELSCVSYRWVFDARQIDGSLVLLCSFPFVEEGITSIYGQVFMCTSLSSRFQCSPDTPPPGCTTFSHFPAAPHPAWPPVPEASEPQEVHRGGRPKPSAVFRW